MKLLTNGKYLWIRTIGSTITGQFLIQRSLYYCLIKCYSYRFISKRNSSGWFVKSFVETVMTPVTYFVVGKLKKLENEDYFDRDTDFNPLIFQVK